MVPVVTVSSAVVITLSGSSDFLATSSVLIGFVNSCDIIGDIIGYIIDYANDKKVRSYNYVWRCDFWFRGRDISFFLPHYKILKIRLSTSRKNSYDEKLLLEGSSVKRTRLSALRFLQSSLNFSKCSAKLFQKFCPSGVKNSN